MEYLFNYDNEIKDVKNNVYRYRSNKMEVGSTLKNSNLTEASLIKFLMGFQFERSKDKSKLFVLTSNKAEQKVVLDILSLLDKHIQSDFLKKYTTPHALVIPYARQLIEKLESNKVPLELDSSDLMEMIQQCVANGATIKYRHPNPSQPRQELSIYHIKSIEELEQIKMALQNAGISVMQAETTQVNNFNRCEQNSSSALSLLNSTAVRIMNQLIARNIDFENKGIFLDFGRNR